MSEMVTEAEKVETYRLQRFLDMGFKAADAQLLTMSDADLHQVEDMLAHGCTHELALLISM